MIISLQIDHKLNYECHNTSQSTIANIKKKLLKATTFTNKKTPKFKVGVISFLLYRDAPHLGHVSNDAYSFRNKMQSLGQECIFS